MEFDDENIIINNIDDDVADTLLVSLLALISKVHITKQVGNLIAKYSFKI